MVGDAATVLGPWSNFYVMTGSSAAALTGLMFVVITLVSGEDRNRSRDGISTYNTPTVVHFCSAFAIAAVLVAPWRALLFPCVLLGLAGIAGMAYSVRLAHRAVHLPGYSPDFEDWCWFLLLPFATYAAILAGALALPAMPRIAPFAFAAGVVAMIFIGIHNAWDVVTYITVKDEQP